MQKLIFSVAALALGWVGASGADNQKDMPQPCVILKRMGPADQVTSHFYSFGLRGKQFQYIEGQLPQGVKFHGRLTDHDVREIQNAGGKVTVIDSHYTQQDLQEARKTCGREAPASEDKAKKAEVGASPGVQPATTSAGPAPAPGAATVPPQPAAQPPGPASVAPGNLATLILKATPDGADVIVDGKYMGSTPSTVRLVPGDHAISIEKPGYTPWQRTLTVSPGGESVISPALQPRPKSLGLDEIIELLKGAVPSDRVVELVQERGVNFRVDDAAEGKLRRAGAQDKLLGVLRKAAVDAAPPQ